MTRKGGKYLFSVKEQSGVDLSPGFPVLTDGTLRIDSIRERDANLVEALIKSLSAQLALWLSSMLA